MKTLQNIRSAAKRFHNNEDGLEALQVVMIIAVAAVALIFVKSQWDGDDGIKKWATDLIKSVVSFKE
ncbi:hypothetical protein [Neorhodopirellula pilleata]|uniref:Uncharacterized protein n=1 Tax=Neorhodopirellula pilleata TaxID=2714738 RepID=A0A5C6AVC1_9BACT|nr:hypothetical protein [Neorhodopirellula pilleata]TWU03690.1 hypothetical protein Pla100_06200 [Neorhodopirellula pilleata]